MRQTNTYVNESKLTSSGEKWIGINFGVEKNILHDSWEKILGKCYYVTIFKYDSEWKKKFRDS